MTPCAILECHFHITGKEQFAVCIGEKLLSSSQSCLIALCAMLAPNSGSDVSALINEIDRGLLCCWRCSEIEWRARAKWCIHADKMTSHFGDLTNVTEDEPLFLTWGCYEEPNFDISLWCVFRQDKQTFGCDECDIFLTTRSRTLNAKILQYGKVGCLAKQEFLWACQTDIMLSRFITNSPILTPCKQLLVSTTGLLMINLNSLILMSFTHNLFYWFINTELPVDADVRERGG